MRIVSPFLKKVLYPALSRAGIFHRTSVSGLAVVTYHGVLPEGYEPVDAALDGNLIRAEVLVSQLRLLKAHYNVISPEDALAWREGDGDGRRALPPRAVLLTCDDGLLNCLTDMLPVLQQEQVSCLFFVTGASTEESRTTLMLWYEELFLLFLRAPAGPFEISGEGILIQGDLGSREQRRAVWWNSVKRLSQVDSGKRALVLASARKFGRNAGQDFERDSAWCRRFGLLTRRELLELASAGMTIGAHTLSHPMLSQLPPELARAEISESRARLEAALEKRVWAFAYPFGDPQSVTPKVLAMAEETGFQAAFLNFGGGLGTALPPYALPRVHVTAGMGLAEFEAHVSGFYARLQRVAGRLRKAVRQRRGRHRNEGLSTATNLQTYDAMAVAAHYATLDYLTPCERVLFEIYIPAGSAILDLGVGGGRTTSYLAKWATRYVGVDYAPAMVKACEARFPCLEFKVVDAANLAIFPDASFDLVVFAFNGIDYVLPEESRQSCFKQVHRVLKANGVFIFSSHNPRAVLVRPRWNRMRLRQTARRFSADGRFCTG